MNETKRWNNSRRDTAYWVAILLLLIVAMNIATWNWLNEIPVMSTLKNLLYNFYSAVIPPVMKKGIEYVILTFLTLYFIILLLIAVLNNICGCLPNIRQSESAGTFRYLLKSAVIFDVFLGIVLEVCAFKGIMEMNGAFRITSIAMWIYISLFAVGSYLYWKHTIILSSAANMAKFIRNGENHECTAWYSITNCYERVSTFSRVPWKGTIKVLIVDNTDLAGYEKVTMESFFYYLIVVDCRNGLDKNTEESIKKVVLLPHANILALFLGESENYEYLEKFLANQKNIKIIKKPEIKHFERINIESVIEDFMLDHKITKKHPLRLTGSEIFKSSYSGIGKGSAMCLDFMKMIINDLDILPSIYALFDFIDLQYRLAIACTLNSDFSQQISWMKNKWKIIGNIGVMAKIVDKAIIKGNQEDKQSGLTADIIFDEILTDNEMVLVKKYLPNYEKDFKRPVEDTVVYLTTSLRNVLRGHGTFDKSDAAVLYALVFKLAILNICILDANEICLEPGNDIILESSDYTYYSVNGNYKGISGKTMSPFLVSTGNGNILVFNNWDKSAGAKEIENIEYINYLDGTLVLPQYKMLKSDGG
ncbi:MAG: hypothetical protein ACI4D3_00260 [Lachnospiraceae bacterium]